MRRKSPRVIWLPQDNENSLGPAEGSSAYQRFGVDVVGSAGSFAVAEIPLVIDAPKDPIPTSNNSLSDIGSSGYRLRRIVGKIFAQTQQQAEDIPRTVIVTAGIIVRRVNDGPASLAFLTGNASTLSPGEIQNTEDPWIWRRSWLLSNLLATFGLLQPFTPGEATNFNHGPSALDGPHVDQKTARVISQEERLFLDVSSTVVEGPSSNQSPLANTTIITTDLRVLGSLRTNSGNRRNASR